MNSGSARPPKIGHLLVTALLVGIFGVLIYVIFIMDRSPVLSEGTRIDVQALLSMHKPILLEFGKGWCKPCKYMKPILEETARAYEGKAVVAAVDMDANVDLVRRFSVRLMPTQVFLWPNGRVFFRNEGVLKREYIAQIFSKMGVDPPERGR
ncbi:MAG: thioredoxin domain-containing protein [Deltaproteobacteria bacterium]